MESLVPAPCFATLMKTINALNEVEQVGDLELDSLLQQVTVLHGLIPNDVPLHRFVSAGGVTTVNGALRTWIRSRTDCESSRRPTVNWRTGIQYCCDLLVKAGEMSGVWPLNGASMVERADAVCVPIDLLHLLLQGECGPVESGDLLRVVDVLAMLWQYNLMGVELMLRHGVLLHLSSATAIPGGHMNLDRLAALSLLSMMLGSLAASGRPRQATQKSDLHFIASNLLQSLRLADRLAVSTGFPEKAVRHAINALRDVTRLPHGLEALKRAAGECGGTHVIKKLMPRTNDVGCRSALQTVVELLPPVGRGALNKASSGDAGTLLAAFPHLDFIASCVAWVTDPLSGTA